MALPTAQEQLMLELVNRSRMDPAGEYGRLTGASAEASTLSALSYFGVNGSALQSQLGAIAPSKPLAWNSNLSNVATTHNQLMIANDSQSHQLPGEALLGTRVTNSGYTGYTSLGENIYAFANNTSAGHAGFVIDWGYDAVDFQADGKTLYADWQTRGDGIQDPPGHRNSLSNNSFKEIGISILNETNPATSVGPFVITQELGTRAGYQAQFIGVVINDSDNDNFYDIGEGLGNIAITLTNGATTYNTTSWSSGGWQIAVPPGNYTITFSGAGLGGIVTKTATLGSDNVKIDAETAEATTPIPAATAGNDILDGDASSNSIHGLAGNDTIKGFGGNDFLYGDSDNDRLEGGEGNDYLEGNDGNDILVGDVGADILIGGSGNDVYGIDSSFDVITELELQGYDVVYSSTSSYQLSANVEELVLSGSALIGYGNGNANVIYGSAETNVLFGGGGSDMIRGGLGADYFLFISPVDSGIDLIADFSLAQGDKIGIGSSAFQFGQIIDGVTFVKSNPTQPFQQILYNTIDGMLYYDPDGTGAKSAIALAQFAGAPTLNASDFVLI